MNIAEIKSRLYNTYITPYNRITNRFNIRGNSSLAPLEKDVFEKSSNVSFTGSVIFEHTEFEKHFPKSFFKKLMKEDLPCAYTGIKMIPREEVDSLINKQVFNKKSEVAMRALKPYKESLYEGSIERRIFDLLEKESKKHPDLKLQELLMLKYNAAEKALVSQQARVLDQIILMARNLSKEDYKKVRKLAQVSFDKMLAQDPLPEERFRRKEFLYSLRDLDISDEKMKQAMIHKAEKLPQSSSSVHAFIVKYAQPYKFKYSEDGKLIKIKRDSEDLALRLLLPSVGTDEHIYPQKLYRQEELARQNGQEGAHNLSDYKVTILTSSYINGLKGDKLFDDFIKDSKFDIPQNIQNHIDRLIEIDKKWLSKGRVEDAARLADYIIALKKEFDLRSDYVDIRINDLVDLYPKLDKKIDSRTKNKKIPHRRLKKTGRASNSHSEAYVDHNDNVMENRKVQKHVCRFSKKFN